MFIATAITNMIMDITILTLPMPFVWRLNMSTRQKLAVSSIFLLGAFVIGISIARIYFFYQSTDSYANALDITVNIAPNLYWTELEASIAIVSACLPTLRPLFSGLSLETFLHEFASRLSIRSSTKSSGNSHAGSIGKWDHSLPNGSESSAARFVNRCEAVRLASSENLPIEIELRQQPGIVVQKETHQSEHERRV
ncbi:Uu.00g130420.m01.CDS01 [Anthostomella pinea]|uniref:Uu.00g130420.m01.CDS01 n=1 Tax=Anthostomella pinea TaxID=933095 RepID=A0AAI8VIM0_9PEZI|nr:Uu.00g130420.m01.CDS01 [Anthostomella pinea]